MAEPMSPLTKNVGNVEMCRRNCWREREICPGRGGVRCIEFQLAQELYKGE